jgi:hypothetical protein
MKPDMSRKIKEFKSKAETALWFVESYGLVPQYLKLESTDGQSVKVDFNPSSSKHFFSNSMLLLSNFCKLKFNCFTFSNSSDNIAILYTLLSKAIRFLPVNFYF